jgi:hypothetical protein
MGHLVPLPQHPPQKGKHIGGRLLLDLLFLFEGSVALDQYLANIIGVACNSQIPHAICSVGYLITFSNSSKGNQRPFCKLQEGIRLFDYRMQYSFILQIFWILHAVDNPFLQAEKRNLITFSAEQKRASNPLLRMSKKDQKQSRLFCPWSPW